MEEKGSVVSGSPANTETDSPVVGVVPLVMNMAVRMSLERSLIGGGEGVMGIDIMGKKKRGRPRKYGSEGDMGFLFSPVHIPSPSDFSPKRGRGRPSGSGNRHVVASFGGWIGNTAGWNFMPHVVTIKTGEDVAAKIFSISQKGPRGICILSANGAISNVTIRQPGSSGGILTYEGRFEILSLSGSFTLTDTSGVRSRTGGLSVSLAGPDGRVIGGGVAGLLTAASPIQIVVGSFLPSIDKVRRKKHNFESSMASKVSGAPDIVTIARPISQATPDNETCMTPTSESAEKNHGEAENSSSSNPNLNSTSFQGVSWQDSQTTLDQKPSPDINIWIAGE